MPRTGLARFLLRILAVRHRSPCVNRGGPCSASKKPNHRAGGALPREVPGKTEWRSTVPTALPRPRRPQAKQKQSALSLLFNTFLVVSAVALTFIVLQREEEYALAHANNRAPLTVQTDISTDLGGDIVSLTPD